jgi:Replication-relaxation
VSGPPMPPTTIRAARELSQLELDVLAVCLHHRLATVDQLHALLTPTATRRWMQRVTGRLAAAGLLASVPARDRPFGVAVRRVWFVTDAGRGVAQTMVPERVHTVTPQRAANALQRHTLLANTVGLAFHQHALRLGHQCGPYDWDHEIAHRYGAGGHVRTVVVDLVVRCWLRGADGGEMLLSRFVEIDRGRYSPLALRAKIRAYARLLTYTPPPRPGAPAPLPPWRSQYPRFPPLLIVFADQSPTVISRRIEVVGELCLDDPVIAPCLRTLGVGCAPLDQVLGEGPYAPIWRTPRSQTPVDLLGTPPTRA